MDEQDIFIQALEQPSAEEQERFLTEVCGDDRQLLSRIKTLLDHHDNAGSFLETPLGSLDQTVISDETPAAHSPLWNELLLESPELAHDLNELLEPAENDDSLGAIGPYQIKSILGRGGMGLVFGAFDPKLSRMVAVKVLTPSLAANATARHRFLREARAAAAVTHPNVVTTHSVDEAKFPYLVMELVDGKTLSEKIHTQGMLPPREVLRIASQAALGLEAAHKQGLIHRDIKPGNILLENGIERAKISDFGLARATDDVGMTRTGEVAGTPQYMSPEQADGGSIDHRSDLFSLGSVIYAMCTGRAPFRAEKTLAVLRRVIEDEPRPIREINPEIPEFLCAIVQKLMRKDPVERFQTASEVAELLTSSLAHLENPSGTMLPVIKTAPVTALRGAKNHVGSKWLITGMAVLFLTVTLGLTEAAGVTRLTATIIELAYGSGTLVIEVDDPTVEISLDGEELSISGAGLKELKLRPGQYRFQATKDGQSLDQKIVSISRGDREVVRVSLDLSPTKPVETSTIPVRPPTTWESFPANAFTLEKVAETQSSRSPIGGLEFSPTGTHLICGWIFSNHLRYWNLQSNVKMSMSKHQFHNGPLAVSPVGRLLATGSDKHPSPIIWDLETMRLLRSCDGHSDFVSAVLFSPDGEQILSASPDMTARLWNVSSGEELCHFDVGFRCFAATFSDDGRSIITAGHGLAKYEIDSQELIWSAQPAGMVTSVSLSLDGQLLATGTKRSNSIQFWNTETGEEVHRIDGHIDSVRGVIFLLDGRHIISSSEDKTLRIWNFQTGEEVARLTASEKIFREIALSPDGRFVASGGGWWHEEIADNSIRVWQLPENVWPENVTDPHQPHSDKSD